MKKLIFIALLLLNTLFAVDINLDSLILGVKKSDKHILVFLHKNNCNFCENMIEFTLDDEDIQTEIEKNFIFVDINIQESGNIIFDDFNMSNREFAKSIGYDFYPSTIFIDEENEIIYAKAGYQNEKKFSKILQYVSTKFYQKDEIGNFK